MFFTEFSLHLNYLNIKLKEFGKLIYVMFDFIRDFEIKLGVFKYDIMNDKLKYFLNLQECLTSL